MGDSYVSFLFAITRMFERPKKLKCTVVVVDETDVLITFI